jgi:hypothetical protein
VIHGRPEDPLGLATLYQNVHFGQFKDTLEAQNGELRSLEVKNDTFLIIKILIIFNMNLRRPLCVFVAA